jgi:thioredoxin-related protein
MPATWMVLVILLWVVVVLLAVTVLGLIRRLGRLERVGFTGGSIDAAFIGSGPEVGSPLPPAPAYEKFSAAAAAADRDPSKRVLLFVGDSCGACHKLAEDFEDASVKARLLDALRDAALILVTDTDDADVFASLPASGVLAAREELTAGWGVPGTPFAVAIDEHGLVRGSSFTSTTAALCEVAATLA